MNKKNDFIPTLKHMFKKRWLQLLFNSLWIYSGVLGGQFLVNRSKTIASLTAYWYVYLI
jgi:hypothetical protein